MSRRSLAFLCALSLAACGGETDPSDSDAGLTTDAGETPLDAGETPVDAGDTTDAGEDDKNEGDTCEGAISAAIGATIEGTTDGAANDVQHTSGCTSRGIGKDRVYRVTLPAGHLLSASVESTDGIFDPAVILREASASCGVALEGCLASDDLGNASAVNTARWYNEASAARDVFVVVDSADEEATGSFKLTLSSEFHEAATNETCSGAKPLVVGTALAGQALTDATVDDYSGVRDGCSVGGPEVAYAVVVPAGKKLTVTGTPGSGLDLVLNLVRGPDAAQCSNTEAACVGTADSAPGGQAESAVWVNGSASEATVFVLVEPFVNGTGTFSLLATLSDPPAASKGGETCETAHVVTPPALLESERLGDAENDLDPTQHEESCTGYVTKGPDRTYAVTVPAGQTLIAEVQPHVGDVGLYLVAGVAACGAEPLVCLTGNDEGSGGEADEIEWTNDTGADADVILVVDTYTESPGDLYYDLAVSLETL